MGNLLVCEKCNGVVVKNAYACPACGAQLRAKGLTVLGVCGALCMVAAVPTCFVVPLGGVGLFALGLVALSLGTSNSPRWFRLRRATGADVARLGLRRGSAASFTPLQTQVLMLALFAALTCGAWFYYAHAMRPIDGSKVAAESSASVAPSSPHVAPSPEPAPAVVSYLAMVHAFDENEIAAQRRYGVGRVRFNATFESVERSPLLGVATLEFSDPLRVTAGHARLEGVPDDELASLKRYAKIILTCRVDGKNLVEPNVVGCELTLPAVTKRKAKRSDDDDE